MSNIDVPEPTSFTPRHAVTGFGGGIIGAGCRLSVWDRDGVQHTGTVQADGCTFKWDEEP